MRTSIAPTEKWDISKRVRSLSCKEFKDLTAAFQQATERALGTPVTVAFTVMDSPRHRRGNLFLNGVSPAEREADCARIDEKNTLLKTTDPDALTQALWDQSYYVTASLVPADPSAGQGASGRIIYNQANSRRADFLMRAPAEIAQSVKKTLDDQRPRFSRVPSSSL